MIDWSAFTPAPHTVGSYRRHILLKFPGRVINTHTHTRITVDRDLTEMLIKSEGDRNGQKVTETGKEGKNSLQTRQRIRTESFYRNSERKVLQV